MESNGRFGFLGLNFHNFSVAETMDKVDYFIKDRKPRMFFTPTAELIVRANKNRRLKNIYDSADLLLIDSFVVYYAARLFGKPVREPVNAARFMFQFLPMVHEKGYRVYLLGAEEEVLKKAVSNLKAAYPGINIVGSHHGYFDFDDDYGVVEDIKKSEPDILFVAMSSPLKENFTYRNLEKMRVPVSIGVGGSLDVIAGKCRPAPRWIYQLGLEWFYRLLQEPRRLAKRYSVTNARFLFLLVKEVFRKRKVK